MASDPLQFVGLYLDMKRRREQSELAKQQLQARQGESVDRGFREAVEMAATGDKKLALSHLSIATRDQDTPAMREYIAALAQHAKSQQQAQAEKAALPKGAEQKDVASGVAGILAQPGDPRLAALAALRSIPDSYPPELTNRLAMRGGAIAADRGARFDRNVALMERQSAITESRQQRKAAGKSGGDSKKLKPEVESAWETFLDAGVPFEEWRSDPEMPRSVVANAMKHPEYVAMLRARKWKGVPFLRPGQEGSAPPPTAVTGPVTLKSGIKIEPLDE
jgi:hypothetical protein